MPEPAHAPQPMEVVIVRPKVTSAGGLAAMVAALAFGWVLVSWANDGDPLGIKYLSALLTWWYFHWVARG